MKPFTLLLSNLVFCLISGERSSKARESMVLEEARYDSVSSQRHTSLVASDSAVCPAPLQHGRHHIFQVAFVQGAAQKAGE